MNRFYVLLFATLCIVSCKKSEVSLNKFSDPVLVSIADFQDRRLTDSLYQFLKSENPEYRKEAALAFASIQDTSSVEQIGKLLSDENAEVRGAAANAVGQTGGDKAFNFLYNSSKDTTYLPEILEAIGKIAKSNSSTPGNMNSWGYYRMGLRGIADSLAIKKATDFLSPRNSETMRLGAAHFLARGPAQITMAETILINAAKNDSSAFVRMAAVSALRKIKSDASLEVIQNIMNNEEDYRVRVNAVRALKSFPFEKTKDQLFKALRDKNVNVGIEASETIKSTATEKFWVDLANLASEIKNWRIQANLYQSVLYAKDNKSIADEIKSRYKQSSNPYQKAALLTALQESVNAYEFIQEELFKADSPVVRSSAASALVAINQNKKFQPTLKKRFAGIYIKALQTEDAAVIGIIAAALGDSILGYRSVINDFSFLYEARKKLSLPKDNESLQPLESAIAHFEKKKNALSVKNEFNHPIDWDLVKSIPKGQLAIIKTSKGRITIRLLVEEAPGSVANFVNLSRQNYFDKKLFHRVVPNFVIQAGCNRGDGYGGEDYSIRSEFSPRKYTTGSVGMASAGKDTESTQWFITHSPTPHLDGRYTIFAEVESGMEVVHLIEVGDQIFDIELTVNR